MWIDKKRFHDLIEEYQELNEDLDMAWLDSRVVRPKGMTDEAFETYKKNRAEFAEYKKKWYAKKKRRLKKEKPEDGEKRRQRLEVVGNELFGIFYELADSVLSGFGFHTMMSSDEFCDDMRQDAMERLLTVVNRFDSRKKNPLAYFIQVIKNYMYNARGDEFAHRYKFLTSSFLETHDLKEDENVVEGKKNRKEKKKKNPFKDFVV